MISETPFNCVRVSLYTKDSLRAFCSLRVYDAVFLTGLRVIECKNGLFVSMPSKKSSNGEYQDIFFPASKAMRNALAEAVLVAYCQEAGLEPGPIDCGYMTGYKSKTAA